jgi:peptidoglycan/xylan/chitin deacetylase (PgdA/CDA1 family)
MMSNALRFAAKRAVKHCLIRGGLEATALPGVEQIFPSAAGRGVIFTLHHVRPARGDAFEPNGHLSVTPEFLDRAIVAASQSGLVPAHLEDLPGLLANPSDRRKFMCFTLDDGYRDNEKYAAPVFSKHNVPYTIFITPGFVVRNRTMWWETAEALTRAASSFQFDFGKGVETVKSSSRLEKLVAFERLADFVETIEEDQAVVRIDQAARSVGVDPESIVDREIMTASELQDLARDPLLRFGGHTITHCNLARVTPERLKREIEQSVAEVAAYGGRAVKTFSYPYGGRNAAGVREGKAAMDAGLAVGVTTQPGMLSSAAPDKNFALPRVSLNGHYQKSRYVKALVSGLPFKLF